MFPRPAVVRASVGLAALGSLVAGTVATAATTHSAVVSSVPAAGTPQILDGAVFAMHQVGDTMVVGGSFTQVKSGGATLTRTRVLAFDAATGDLLPRFAPQLDGVVQTLLPGPSAGTVYVGGEFNNVNGAPGKSLVLLDLATGAVRSGFRLPMNGTVQSVDRVGSRLIVGGSFTKIAGKLRGGLASVVEATSTVDEYLTSKVTENHNWTPASPSGNTKGAVGVTRLDVSPDGRALVAVGNFRKVDGVVYDQMARWDLGADQAVLRNWRTLRLEPPCLEKKYDSYVRDVAFSPDSSYFVLVNVGGYRAGTLCDAASRWETGATGQQVEPTWVAYTGADSLLSTAVSGEAVYVGGHQRWLNNGLGRDTAGQGAVPRPGVAALDPLTGLPLAWNPGRHPRGVGTTALHVSPVGLWMGSDTSFVGPGPDSVASADRCTSERSCYLRGKVALFPLAGGEPAASQVLSGLPGGVHLASVPAGSTTDVLRRVNVGGPLLRTIDAGPDWARDDAAAPYPGRTNGGTVASYGIPVRDVDAAVPAGTPDAVFADERRDPGVQGDGKELRWSFPVPQGQPVDVRVYVANRCACIESTAPRSFDVTVGGTVRTVDLAAVPLQGGTVVSFRTTSTGTVTVAYTHGTGDPVVSALEIVKAGTGPYPTGPADLSVRSFDGSTAGPASSVASPLDVASIRGAVLIGDTLFYGKTDSGFYRRSVAGTTYGPEVEIDPYADPLWSDVETGSGNVYRGSKPAFYNDITNLTSLFYDGKGRMYYTLYRQTGLYSRAFSPDSGIFHHDERVVADALPGTLTGAFLAEGSLYYADSADGTLRRTGFDGRPTGSGQVVGDGADWRGRALWLGRSPGSNAAPTAAFTVACDFGSCAVDGSGSRDTDGVIRSWSWTYGDGATATGATPPAHEYSQDGTYPITLTVADNDGARTALTKQVTVRTRPASAVSHVGSTLKHTASVTQTKATLPAGVQEGDTLLLAVTTNGTSGATAPDGWVPVGAGDWANGTATRTLLWQRTATAQDVAGSEVALTFGSQLKASAAVLAYRGVGAVAAVEFAGDGTAGTSHPTPASRVDVAGSWVVSYWTDKTATADHGAFGVPGELTARLNGPGSGGSYLSTLVADEGGGRPAGSAPARTATTGFATRAAMLSIVLAPAS